MWNTKKSVQVVLRSKNKKKEKSRKVPGASQCSVLGGLLSHTSRRAAISGPHVPLAAAVAPTHNYCQVVFIKSRFFKTPQDLSRLLRTPKQNSPARLLCYTPCIFLTFCTFCTFWTFCTFCTLCTYSTYSTYSTYRTDFLLSTVYCLLSTVYCLLLTVNWLEKFAVAWSPGISVWLPRDLLWGIFSRKQCGPYTVFQTFCFN